MGMPLPPAPHEAHRLLQEIIEPRVLRGVQAIADYHQVNRRRMYDILAKTSFPSWDEGGLRCSDTLVIELWKLLQQIYKMQGKKFHRDEIVALFPLFALALKQRPTNIEEITALLISMRVLRRDSS